MLVTTLACLCSLVQCPDPAVPAGGFAIDERFDLQITFSDAQTTTADVRHPLDAPGPCGWPLIVFIHGLYGSKASMANYAEDFARDGYLTVAFDVRGHASATGEHAYFGLRERLDLAEVIFWAQATFSDRVDPERIGVAGGSQGAIFSWDGAAWSGEPFESNPWIAGAYPEVDAIVVDNLTADFGGTFAPRGRAVHCSGAASLLGNGPVRFDPALQAQAANALCFEDYAAWSAIVSDPLRDPALRVASIDAPTMVMTAWDDFWFPATSIIESWQALPPTTPRKLYLGTGGHSTPGNHHERLFRDGWRLAWMDRFLKSIDNGIDAGPAIEYAITPNDVDLYLASNSHWQHATAATWPPQGTYEHRLFLREGALLSRFAATQVESFELLEQVAEPSYDLAAMANDDFRLALILPNIPRNQLLYDSPLLQSALSYAGDARVHLSIKCATDRYQVSASLWDVAPDASERYVASGGYFVFDDAPAGANEFEVVLSSNAYEFAAGHRVRVRLENMQVHETPVGETLRFAPYPHDFSVEIHHSPGELSWLDLPIDGGDVLVFGNSQLNSAGCVPMLTTTGSASASAATPFAIAAHQVVNNKEGLLLYGLGAQSAFFHGGWIYVAPPMRRTSVQNSGGNPPPDDCSGVFSFDFNALVASGTDPALVPGARVVAQYWSRDPASPATTNLTNALEFTLQP